MGNTVGVPLDERGPPSVGLTVWRRARSRPGSSLRSDLAGAFGGLDAPSARRCWAVADGGFSRMLRGSPVDRRCRPSSLLGSSPAAQLGPDRVKVGSISILLLVIDVAGSDPRKFFDTFSDATFESALHRPVNAIVRVRFAPARSKVARSQTTSPSHSIVPAAAVSSAQKLRDIPKTCMNHSRASSNSPTQIFFPRWDSLSPASVRQQVRLIASLAELDSRRLYLGAGCSSLFTSCTQVLHLSEHAAYGRIEAARAARRFPLILDLLADGSINLTAIGLLAAHLTTDNHLDLLNTARHKSKRDIEHVIARRRSQPEVRSAVRKLPQAKTLEEVVRAAGRGAS